MTAVPSKADSTGASSAGWKTLLPRPAPALLLLLPACALVQALLPSGRAEAVLLLLAGVAAWLFVGSSGALRRFASLNPLSRARRADRARLRISRTAAWLPRADAMLEQALADRRPLSIGVVELHDLAEVRQLFGRDMANRVLDRVSRQLRVVAGAKGLAVRTSRTQFTLVLPGLDAAAVQLALGTVFGAACCIEDDDSAEEMVLLPCFQVTTLTGPGEAIASSHRRLCEAVAGWQCDHPLPEASHLDTAPLPVPKAGPHVRPVYVPTVPLPLP